MKKFKIRASSCGSMMTGRTSLTENQYVKYLELKARKEGEGKPLTAKMEEELEKYQHTIDNPQLPETVKTYLQTWVKEQIYGSRSFNGNKATQKGNEMEESAIDYLSAVDGSFYIKNEEYFEDDDIKGTPDIIFGEKIIDTKCPWNEYTMPLFEDKLPNSDYFWQMQCYMALTGATEAEVVYVLMNTPEDLLNPWTDVPNDYEMLDSVYRVKRFKVERDNKAIENIRKRVILCREYIKELMDGIHK